MLTIKKVLNSSVVLVVDEHDVERVLLGKGIGYGRKPGDPVPSGATDRTFIAFDDERRQELVQLLAQIPGEYIDISRLIVDDATANGFRLDPHVYVTLSDHLHFAVMRMRKGLLVMNRLAWEVRTIYPREYEVGTRAVATIRERLGIELPDDEAANIAFHLVNAEEGRSGVDSMRVVRLVADVTRIVSLTSGLRFDRSDVHASRFMTHLQFFAERLEAGRLLEGDDDALFRTMLERAPRAVASAERVRSFVETDRGVRIPDEEVAYLALHIARALPPGP